MRFSTLSRRTASTSNVHCGDVFHCRRRSTNTNFDRPPLHEHSFRTRAYIRACVRGIDGKLSPSTIRRWGIAPPPALPVPYCRKENRQIAFERKLIQAISGSDRRVGTSCATFVSQACPPRNHSARLFQSKNVSLCEIFTVLHTGVGMFFPLPGSIVIPRWIGRG